MEINYSDMIKVLAKPGKAITNQLTVNHNGVDKVNAE